MAAQPPTDERLPVVDVLEALAAALNRTRRVVLTAPPGGGKTTVVPPWLVASGRAAGQVIVLQPRRAAARAVARRLAHLMGVRLGDDVGYWVRFDKRCSASSRVIVVTEGILTGWVQRDPELAGVSHVVFDEFHERSLHADLALALCLEVQEGLREDLELVVMSATLNAERLASLLGCDAVTAAGRQFPLTFRYYERPLPRDLPKSVASVVPKAFADGSGDVLVFLPGVGEIERTHTQLRPWAERHDVAVRVLHGRLPPDAQDRVLRQERKRRVVLSTNLAETSLTVAGVTTVVDGGYVKTPYFERRAGCTRLETERVSAASAVQRAGRAGRLAPGVAHRLWPEAEQARLVSAPAPAILRVELTSMALELRAWGVREPSELKLVDQPDPARWSDALELLMSLGAINDSGVTALGRQMLSIPAHPRVAAMVCAGRKLGVGASIATWAAALELGMRANAGGGPGDADPPRQWRAALTSGGGRAAFAAGVQRRLQGRSHDHADLSVEEAHSRMVRATLAGYGDRVGRRVEGGNLQLVGGRGAELARESCVSQSDYLIAVGLDAGRRGQHSRARVTSAVEVALPWLEADERCVSETRCRWDAGRERVVGTEVVRYLDLVLRRHPARIDDPLQASTLLATELSKTVPKWRARVRDTELADLARLSTYARHGGASVPVELDAMLLAALPLACAGRTRLDEVLAGGVLMSALLDGLPWSARERFARECPRAVGVPSGRDAKLSYQFNGPPVLAVKVQEVYGASETPSVFGGRVTCLLHLLDPAGRPLQITQSLDTFWSSAWPAVRSEMRSRYPKHRWPEDPASAAATVRSTQRRKR